MNPVRQRFETRVLLGIGLLCAALVGCRSNQSGNAFGPRQPRFPRVRAITKTEPIGRPGDGIVRQPDSNGTPFVTADTFARPLTTATEQLPAERRDLTLDEAIAIAVSNAEVLRSLGGQALRNPQGVAAVFDPALQATDPVFGIDAALAAFDTQLSGGINYARNDDVFNNAVTGGGANEVQQDLATANFGLQRTGRVGTRYSLRGNLQYDDNTRPTNLFDSAYTTLLEAEVRQPLLQGRGVEFNQIAGPNGQPGFRSTSGILISRINNDISVAQFERNVRQFADDVINAYWQLYFAYRNFDAIQDSLTSAQDTYRIVRARFDNDLPGGEADKEAQAREQLYLFKAQLAAALGGDRRADSAGLLQAEADLRRLLNLPQSDQALLRPSDAPNVASIVYDWDSLVHEAIGNRVEVREQSWRIKRRELELLAARQFTQPRLDAVALLRNQGFGDTLGSHDGNRFDSALRTAGDGDFNEWELGLQLNVPLGYRQGAASVRNGQLQLQRERAVLREQQKQIVHDLGTAMRQSDQTQVSVELASKRLEAARDTVEAREAAFEADAVPFDQLLEAQRRLADARIAYERATIEWATANEAISRESGQLLANHHVYLEAFGLSAQDRVSRNLSDQLRDYRISR